MKRLMLLILTLLLGLAVAVPASANQPTDELTALAAFAPADTVAFGVARIDNGYIETLEGVINSRLEAVAATLPEGTVPPAITADDIAPVAEFRAFAGDYIAFFVPSAQAVVQGDDNPFVGLTTVEDFDAAIAYFDDLYEFDMEFGDIEKVEQEDGSVLYEATVSFLDSTLVTTDLAITGSIASVVMPGDDMLSLADTETFQNAVAALPEAEYNIFGYLNNDPIVAVLEEFAPSALEGTGITVDFDLLAESLGQFAVGFTLLEGRVLTVDVVQVAPALIDATPLDLSVLDSVPADTPFVIQGGGIGGTLAGMTDALYLLNDLLLEQGLLPIPDAGPLDFLGPDDIATFITLSLEGTYNFDLAETLAWMDGDFLLAMRPRLNINDLFDSGLDFAFLLATDNPEATAALVEEVAKNTIAAFSAATFEDGMLRTPLGALISQPELGVSAMTSTDSFLAMGSAALVDDMLAPEAALSGTDNYAFESSLFVDDPYLLFYIDFAPIAQLLVDGVEAINMGLDGNSDALNTLAALLDSSAISAGRADGIATTRLTITLGELE